MPITKQAKGQSNKQIKIRKPISAFSLIELMVSVAIVGIIAAIATPAYIEYLGQGYRSEAMRELVTVVNLQEQYLIENRTYTTDMKELGFAADPYESENERYNIDATAIADISSDFIVTATATDAQKATDLTCYTISMNYLLQKSATDSEGNDSTDTCWGQ